MYYGSICVVNVELRYRAVAMKVLQSWRRYVPLSREERRKEVRRAELRRKVAQWLPDYLPESNSQD